MSTPTNVPDGYAKPLRMKRGYVPFSGLMDAPELAQLFDASMILNDVAYELGAYDVAHLLEQTMDAILVHKARCDKQVYSFKTCRNLPKVWEKEKKGLEDLRQRMILKIAENAVLSARQLSRKSNRKKSIVQTKKVA